MFKSLYLNRKLLTTVKYKFRSLSNQPFDRDYFRLIINHLLSEIEENPKYFKIVVSKNINELNVWPYYLNVFRRNLIKDPQTFIKSEFDQLCLKLNEIDKVLTNNDINSEQRKYNISICTDYLFNLIISKAEIDLKDMIDAHKSLSTAVDLKKPYNWYPMTRLMKRNIIYHGGPTNSGKTYHALQRLKEADVTKGGGLYCGPLRLLALEVYEQLNRQGIYTNLVTGQEKKEILGATHVSSTLEMVSTTKEYDIAVIDEIQMIADRDRGFAWTRALLGLKAREIHLCGGLEAEQLVRSLTESTGDNFILHKYERLSTLHIEEKSLQGDYTKVKPGDCIVAFTKADIFSIRKEIEENTKYKCALIYGQLPPETRSTQARLFNEDDSGYDILVASDAIGMGLNLNIRRIIFHTALKIIPSVSKIPFWIEPTHIKQIAGRAGRLSSQYKIGLVTAWQEVDLAYIRAVMKWDIPQIQSAGMSPLIEQIESFTEQLDKVNAAKSTSDFQKESEIDEENELNTNITNTTITTTISTDNNTTNNDTTTATIYTNNTSNQVIDEQSISTSLALPSSNSSSSLTDTKNIRLSSILSQFLKLSQIDSRFFMCEYIGVQTLANWLHTIPLSIGDRYIFANCPITLEDEFSMRILYQYVASYALKKPVSVNIRLSTKIPNTLKTFSDLCVKHNVLDLYLWLSLRFPEYFVEREQCLKQKEYAINQIEATLSNSGHFYQESAYHKANYCNKRDLLGYDLPISLYGEFIHHEYNNNLSKIPKKLYYIV